MINLHNHSTWSDGLHPPELLVKMGILSGLTHIGITDHFYTEKLTDVPTYVDVDQIDAYLADVRAVAERYQDRIQVLAGLEVDWSARVRPRLLDLWPVIDRFDYVLFEYVGDAAWSGDSLGTLCRVRPQIHIPVGLAHPDLIRSFESAYAPAELASVLEAHDIFVELSTGPQTMYYRDEDPDNVRLWEALAHSRVRFSIGSDTHHSVDAVARVADAHRFLTERGLLDRLITAWWDPARRTWRKWEGARANPGYEMVTDRARA